jgi:hypothetical protein
MFHFKSSKLESPGRSTGVQVFNKDLTIVQVGKPVLNNDWTSSCLQKGCMG